MKAKPSNKIHCNDAVKYICENLDEDLNSRKCRAIKKHLQTCTNCSKDLGTLKKIITLYRMESAPSLSREVQKKLFAALKLEV